MTKTLLTFLLFLAVIAGTTTITVVTTNTVFATTGMSNCTEEEPDNEDCNPQPDRVGNDHDEDDEVNRDGPDEKEDANCWGKVTSELATENKGIGGHSSDPVPGDEDNETPREGVGNQDEDHPSDHADVVGPQFGSDEECTED